MKPDATTLRRLYVDERKSSGEIGRMFERSSPQVCAWLRAAGIKRRSASEASQLFLSTTSYESRLAMTRASRAIITGRKRSDDDLERRALGKQRGCKLSGLEQRALDCLRAAGLDPVPLLAVGKFNVDMGFPAARVALEVDGGNWHKTDRRKRAADAVKAAFLAEQGWTLLRVPNADPATLAPVAEAIQALTRHA